MIENKFFQSSHCGSAEMNPTSIYEDAGLISGPTQWVKDPVLLWLWCRPAAAAPIQPLDQKSHKLQKDKTIFFSVLYNDQAEKKKYSKIIEFPLKFHILYSFSMAP